MATFQYLDEGNSEAQDRLATSYLLTQTQVGLATTGVLSGLSVTQTATASGSVLIAAGAAPVQASVGTGVALLVNDTLATLDVFTADPMGGLPRNDIVAFDSVTKAIIAIIGTPNATPDDPTVPDTACALARLRHAASATTIPTAKIDDLRAYTTLRGVSPSAPYAQAAGIVYLAGTAVAAGSSVHTGIAFPAGRFNRAPLVTATMITFPNGSEHLTVRCANVAYTGALLYLYNVGATTDSWSALTIHWTAVQMTASSSDG